MERIFKSAVLAMVISLFLGCGQSKSTSLEGKVVDGKGQPMAKVKIIAKQVEPIKGYEQFEVTTDGDGKFTFRGLFPASAYDIFPYWDNKNASVRLKVQSGPEGQTKLLANPLMIRFTKAKDGVISDSVSGLEWYLGPKDINWKQAKVWTARLVAAGGRWRMPTVPELISLLKEGPHGMFIADPFFFSVKDNNIIWAEQVGDVQPVWEVELDSGRKLRGGNMGSEAHFNRRAFAVRSKN